MNVEEYTQHQLEEEGVYRAFPVAWTVVEKDSGAVAIRFQFAVHQKWHGKEQGWSQEWPPGYFSYNDTWIVGRADKGGDTNQGAIENLGKCGLWDGDFDKLSGPVPSVFVLIDVGCETYEGKTRYRAEWVNQNADVPTPRGGFAPADPNVLAQLRARFQSATRAIAGGQPAGQAPAPPATAAAPVQTAPVPPAGWPATPAAAPVQAAPVNPAPQPATPAAPQAAPVAPPAAVPAAAPTAPAAPQAAPAAAPVAPAAPGAPQTPTPAPVAQPPQTPAQGFVAPPASGAPDDPIDPDPDSVPF